MNEGRQGSVAYSDYSNIFDQYMELVPGYSTGPTLENCNAAGNGVLLRYTYTDTYEIHCKDGSATTSPFFRLYNLTKGQYIE
jgi:hypothetical protein